MAMLIDEPNELPEDSTLEQTTEQTTTAEKQETKETVFEIPDKYRGKSPEDLVKMHQEAEKLTGKHAQEVGEVRKLADELLRQQLKGTPKEPEPSVEDNEVDFFADPKAAVQRAVESHPAVKEAQRASLLLKQQETARAIQQRHPDWLEVGKSAEFAEWVKASKVRTGLYLKADQEFDVDSADELLSTFKELRAVKKTQQDTQAKADSEVLRQSNLKAAAVDVGGTGEVSKKVYRRADLIRLKMTDPQRYNDMQEEIMSAYAENRVK